MKIVLIIFLSLVSTAVNSTEPPKIMRQVCVDIGGSFCQRARECFPDGAPSQSECVGMFVKTCCENTETCGQEVREIDAEDWEKCLDAILRLSCEDINKGEIPRECSVV